MIMIKEKIKKVLCSTKVIILACLILSCTETRFSDNLAKNDFINHLKEMYEIDSITNHFPNDWINESLRSTSWSASYYPCNDYLNFEVFRFAGVYSDVTTIRFIDSIEKNINAIGKSFYDDSLLLKIDIPYMRDEQSYNQYIIDTMMIPVYNFRDACFHLGCEEDSLLIKGVYWKGVREVLPLDLIVYVIDARPGNFWKNKELAEKEPRPCLPQKWKHGYSRGIGVSRSCKRVCGG